MLEEWQGGHGDESRAIRGTAVGDGIPETDFFMGITSHKILNMMAGSLDFMMTDIGSHQKALGQEVIWFNVLF